jgi:hypothetical protein
VATVLPGWFTASFTSTADTNARTEALDTRHSTAAYESFHVGANWSERFAMLHGQPTERAFALDASQSVGQAPPPALARNFELRLAGPPKAGERYDLTAGGPARFWFADGYRFDDNVWQAEAGSVSFSAGANGLLHAEIQDARMQPRYQGVFFGSDAKGSFTLTAAGDFPVGLEPSPAPTPVASCPPPKGPDVMPVTVRVYDKAGRPVRTDLPFRIDGLDPAVPYLVEGYTHLGAYSVSNAPVGTKARVTVMARCSAPVTRTVVFTSAQDQPCGAYAPMTVDFGGPDASESAVDAPATIPSCEP